MLGFPVFLILVIILFCSLHAYQKFEYKNAHTQPIFLSKSVFLYKQHVTGDNLENVNLPDKTHSIPGNLPQQSNNAHPVQLKKMAKIAESITFQVFKME